MDAMQQTMLYLCKNIQGCKFGYTQSDEITLILTDYDTFETQAWFDYEVQKMCSIAASMATMAFNKFFYASSTAENTIWETCGGTKEYEAIVQAHQNAAEKGAMFDARCFNIPKEEVTNLIYWRQLDATRNSIQMVGQANFSHRELQNKSCNMIQDMLHEEKGINWNEFPTECKRGSACRKVKEMVNIAGTMEEIETWEIDRNMPILKGEDREYVESLIRMEN